MTGGIGIVSSTAGATNAPAAVSTSTQDQDQSIAATSPSFIKTAVGSLQNPRVTLDPSAGFITQYLSANGSQVVSQTPNAITVAYLRLGLTSEGRPKSSPTEHVGTTA